MPFSPDTKARMFIKCARLCCLCLKQCGTNIEAAHIHDEGKGGSNDEENGIPACFDCHQEIGAYDPKHPKGNKFSHEELRARRDRIYKLVKSGVIFALIVAQNARVKARPGTLPELQFQYAPEPSNEAEKLLEKMLEKDVQQNTFGGKVKMLSSHDRAFVLDELAKRAPSTPRAMEVLTGIAKSTLITQEEVQVIIERTIREVTLFGTLSSKAAMLEGVPAHFLAEAADELREAIFEEAIAIIRRDQFEDVNKLVPALENHLEIVPKNLQADFVFALFAQSRSSARQGAPAAQRMLRSLPISFAKNAVREFDGKRLSSFTNHEDMRAFVKNFKRYALDEQGETLDDFLALSSLDFKKKYCPLHY